MRPRIHLCARVTCQLTSGVHGPNGGGGGGRASRLNHHSVFWNKPVKWSPPTVFVKGPCFSFFKSQITLKQLYTINYSKDLL